MSPSVQYEERPKHLQMTSRIRPFVRRGGSSRDCSYGNVWQQFVEEVLLRAPGYLAKSSCVVSKAAVKVVAE